MSAFAYGFGEPCLPTRVPVAPAGPERVHEIKHDGYRLMVRRTGAGIRIRTRHGYDWTDPYPGIVEAAAKPRASSFVLDGEGRHPAPGRCKRLRPAALALAQRRGAAPRLRSTRTQR